MADYASFQFPCGAIQDRLTLVQEPASTTTITYDGAGNLTSELTPFGNIYFTWDAPGRMVNVEPVGGIITFTYNAEHQQVGKTSYDGSSTGYLYNFNNLLQETDGIGGDIDKTYTSMTNESFGDLLSEHGDSELYHQNDAQWSTNALSDDAGNSTAPIRNTAFGLSASNAGEAWVNFSTDEWANMSVDNWADFPVNPPSNMGGFGGEKQYYLIGEIGLYMLGMGVKGRIYDPPTGRFGSEDPLRQAGGDNDLYVYVGNDPINSNDPSGENRVNVDTAFNVTWINTARSIWGLRLANDDPPVYLGRLDPTSAARNVLFDDGTWVPLAEVRKEGDKWFPDWEKLRKEHGWQGIGVSLEKDLLDQRIAGFNARQAEAEKIRAQVSAMQPTVSQGSTIGPATPATRRWTDEEWEAFTKRAGTRTEGDIDLVNNLNRQYEEYLQRKKWDQEGRGTGYRVGAWFLGIFDPYSGKPSFWDATTALAGGARDPSMITRDAADLAPIKVESEFLRANSTKAVQELAGKGAGDANAPFIKRGWNPPYNEGSVKTFGLSARAADRCVLASCEQVQDAQSKMLEVAHPAGSPQYRP